MQDLYGDPVVDGLLIRDSQRWALDKLAVVECYVSGFSRACSRKLSEWQIVDGFAGPGINRIIGGVSEPLAWGTPILCCRADPPVPRILAMDSGKPEVEALEARTAGEPRISVERGDVNRDLVPAMSRLLNRRVATLCILDPEGTELDFDRTVGGLARWRMGRFKTELLILFPTHMGFMRMLPHEGEFEWAPSKLDRMFGSGADWRSIWERRRAAPRDDAEASAQATRDYVRLYARQLEGLGYQTVLDREIRSSGRTGRVGYYLIFATDNDAGRNIMDHCFDTRWDSSEQLELFRSPRSSHLREA